MVWFIIIILFLFSISTVFFEDFILFNHKKKKRPTLTAKKTRINLTKKNSSSKIRFILYSLKKNNFIFK